MARNFRYWAQKILPLVYDESLSYYEILCKISEHIAEIDEEIDDLKIDPEEVRAMIKEEVIDYLDDTQIYEIVMQQLNLYYADVTDYGADPTGTNDSTIAFSDAIASGKKIIIVPKGHYIINNLIVPSDTTILGYGADLEANLMMNGQPNILRNNNPQNLEDYSAVENIRLEGLGFTAPNIIYCTMVAFGHARNIMIKNCHFHHWNGWHGVEFNAVSNGTVEGCTFDNYGSLNPESVFGEMLQIDWMLDPAIFPWFGPYNRLDCENIKIINNTFLGTTAIRDNTASPFIQLYAAIGSHSQEPNTNRNHTITGNYIENFYKGMHFYHLYNSNISDNIIKNCYIGLRFQYYFTGNNVCNNNIYGVQGTTLHDDEWRGITVYRDAAHRVIRDNLIDNNNIAYFTHGIWFEGWNTVVSNNSCSYCYLSGITAGIRSSGTQYRNNKVVGSTGDNTHKSFTINIYSDVQGIDSGGLVFTNNNADYCYINAPYTSDGRSFVYDNNFAGGITYGPNGSTNVTLFRNLVGGKYNSGLRSAGSSTAFTVDAGTWVNLPQTFQLNRGGVYLVIFRAATANRNALLSVRAQASGTGLLATNSIMTGDVVAGYAASTQLLVPLNENDSTLTLSVWLSVAGDIENWSVEIVDLAISPL